MGEPVQQLELCDVDEYGNTLLHTALINAKFGPAKILLTRRPALGSCRNHAGYTPFESLQESVYKYEAFNETVVHLEQEEGSQEKWTVFKQCLELFPSCANGERGYTVGRDQVSA